MQLSSTLVSDRPFRHMGAATLTNPLIDRGQDPYLVYHQGCYYLLMSEDDRRLTLRRATRLADLRHTRPTVVWDAPRTGPMRAHIWAPEMALIDGHWYIYFAADDGRNETHRMYVLESVGHDPLGPYREKGKIAAATDTWAIDGTVLAEGEDRYFIWSGWPGYENVQQNLYIAVMDTPWSLSGERVLLSEPTYSWEIPTQLPGGMHDGVIPCVNEGPALLHRHGRVFLVYSANGSWTDDYCLGLLTREEGSDSLDPHAWRKSPEPVFVKNPAAGVYAPGHNSFFQSPNGREDWMIYHANLTPRGGWKKRTVMAQQFSWRADGRPDFGVPLAPGMPYLGPAGEAAATDEELAAA